MGRLDAGNKIFNSVNNRSVSFQQAEPHFQPGQRVFPGTCLGGGRGGGGGGVWEGGADWCYFSRSMILGPEFF